MSSTGRTPSPEYYAQLYQTGPQLARTNRQEPGVALAYGLDGQGDFRLTTLTGRPLGESHNNGPPRAASPSPFDSPTSYLTSTSAYQNGISQDVFMNNFKTAYPPGSPPLRPGTPTRPSRKGPGRAILSSRKYSRPLTPSPAAGRDPVKRFLAEELYELAGQPVNPGNTSGLKSTRGVRPLTPASSPHKRTASMAFGDPDSDLDTIIEHGRDELASTGVAPEMDRHGRSKGASTPEEKSIKRAKFFDYDSVGEELTGHYEPSKPKLPEHNLGRGNGEESTICASLLAFLAFLAS
ncbi:hypothetical protein F4811DRAFT_550050 [Daldinia bambusicola]|nr:hypothetical protein F4811DRAFT_550050 [Daldinia bambusicola]